MLGAFPHSSSELDGLLSARLVTSYESLENQREVEAFEQSGRRFLKRFFGEEKLGNIYIYMS